MKLLIFIGLVCASLTCRAQDSIIGVGLVLETAQDKILVQEFVANSPAEKSGLIIPGDIVEAVQADVASGAAWVPTQGLQLNQVVAMIRGPLGTQVGIQLEHTNGEAYSVILQREKIDVN